MRSLRLALAVIAIAALAADGGARASARPPVRVSLVLTRHPPALQPFLDAFDAAATRDGAAIVRVHSFEGRVERVDGVLREIGAAQPDVIVGVFEQACGILVRRRGVLPPVPILHALTLEPPVFPVSGGNGVAPLPGLSASLPVDRVVTELQRFLPAARRIGVVGAPSSQARIEEAVARLKQARSSVEVRVLLLEDVGQAGAPLRELMPSLDACIVVADRLAAQEGFLEQVARVARERTVPLVVPSREWVEKGALVAIDAELPALGAQAAALALEAARGRPDFATAAPAEVVVTVSRTQLDRFPAFRVPEDADVRWAAER